MMLRLGWLLLAVGFALPTFAQVAVGSVRDRYREAGADVSDMSQVEFDAYVRADLEKWRKVAREANIVVE